MLYTDPLDQEKICWFLLLFIVVFDAYFLAGGLGERWCFTEFCRFFNSFFFEGGIFCFCCFLFLFVFCLFVRLFFVLFFFVVGFCCFLLLLFYICYTVKGMPELLKEPGHRCALGLSSTMSVVFLCRIQQQQQR